MSAVRRLGRAAPTLLVALLLLLSPVPRLLAGGRGADHTRYFPLDHPVYDYLDRLQERGLLLSLDRALRPYTRQQVANAVTAQDRVGLAAFETAWLDRVARECAFETAADSPSDSARMTVIVRPEASANLRSLRPDRHSETAGLGFGGRFGAVVFDSRFLRAPQFLRSPDSTDLRDPDVRPPVSEGLIRPMEGYLKADFATAGGAFDTEIFFGRMARNWSPDLDVSLILSGAARSFDHLGLVLRSPHLTLSHVVARLDGIDYRAPDGSWLHAERFFTSHRLDIRVRDRLRFGITESTVYGGPGAGFDPALTNPFTSYRLVAIENKSEHTNNTLIALDGFLNVKRRVSLFGQFLFDDFLRDKNIQDRWAASLGLDWRDPPMLCASTAGLRATLASSFVYDTFKPWERYLVAGRPLGAALGNDYADGEIFLRRFFGPNMDLKAGLGLTTRGAHRIEQPAADMVGSAGLPFPTPTVWRAARAGLELRWQPLEWARLSAQAGYLSERNIDNHPGENRRRGYAALTVSLFRDIPVSF